MTRRAASSLQNTRHIIVRCLPKIPCTIDRTKCHCFCLSTLQTHLGLGRTCSIQMEMQVVLCAVVNVYVPNSGEGLKRLEYRVGSWDVDFADYLAGLIEIKPVVLTGDLNCAHQEIDIHDPKRNLKSAGFTKVCIPPNHHSACQETFSKWSALTCATWTSLLTSVCFRGCRKSGSPLLHDCCREVSRTLSGRCTLKWSATLTGTTGPEPEQTTGDGGSTIFW